MLRKGLIVGLVLLLPLLVTVAASAQCPSTAPYQRAVDYWDTITRNFFLSLIPSTDSGDYTIAQVCDIFDYCYSHWTYVSDPTGLNYVASASETIQNGLHGDCDDFAVLMAAGIVVIEGTSEIITVFNGTVGHAFAGVYLGSTAGAANSYAEYLSNRYQVTGSGFKYFTDNRYWLNLDYTAGHPGGPSLMRGSTTCRAYRSPTH